MWHEHRKNKMATRKKKKSWTGTNWSMDDLSFFVNVVSKIVPRVSTYFNSKVQFVALNSWLLKVFIPELCDPGLISSTVLTSKACQIHDLPPSGPKQDQAVPSWRWWRIQTSFQTPHSRFLKRCMELGERRDLHDYALTLNNIVAIKS